MFNKNSIFFTLFVSATISILLLIFSFFSLVQKDKVEHINELKVRYFTVIKLFAQEYNRVGFTQSLDDVINDMDFEIVNAEEISDILAYEDLSFLAKKRVENLLVYILRGKDHNYIHIITPFDEYLLVDNEIPVQLYKGLTVFLFIVVLGGFVLLFYQIYKKLYPLQELKEKVIYMGDDNIEYETIKPNGKDEVSLLANEFKKKAHDLKQLKEARNVFIRNIMHELKTPITKGRFLIELPNSEENKEKLVDVFHQMESLINEFASIEEVISKGDEIEKKEYYFSDVLDNALDKLLICENRYTYDDSELKVKVNYKLFTIAVKNLIDNALKYSPNKKVDIFVKNNTIYFTNEGEPLKYELKNYFEPFFNSESNGCESFGLGLYIIHSIVEAHKFELLYEFEDGKNIFKIVCTDK